jgi:hypothetical protein
MPNTRSANARPGHEEPLENAALRSRVKKSYEKAQQEEAFKELLKLIGANSGKLTYGSMDKHIKKFKDNGFKAVTRQNLNYRLKNMKSNMTIDKLVGKNLSISGDNSAVVSDLSGETFHDSSNNATETNTSTNSITISESKTNIGGQKKGSALAAKAADAKKKRRCDNTMCDIV